MMQKWRTPVQVESRTRRNADGYLVQDSAELLISGCLIAPGAFTVPGLLEPETSEQSNDQATLYAPPGTQLEVGDTVVLPQAHPLGGKWQVESNPAPWPRGVSVTIKRR